MSAPYPYRAADPGANALADPAALALELDRAILSADPDTVAAFVAEPIVGATLCGVVPPDGYWRAILDVCRRHGVLVIADEVMTGFGRTGTWFGMDHWGARPDIVVAAKGATSGYWPFGFVAASDRVHRTVVEGGGFVHGFTYSHSIGGATVAREVLRILREEDLVAASATKGAMLRELLAERLGGHPHVGEIRGSGLLVGVEIVEDRETPPGVPAGREAHGGGRDGRARGRAAALLGDRLRRRDERRRDPPGPALRRDRAGARADRGRPAATRWTPGWRGWPARS